MAVARDAALVLITTSTHHVPERVPIRCRTRAGESLNRPGEDLPSSANPGGQLHIHRFNDGLGEPEKFALQIDFGRAGEEIVSAASLPGEEPTTVHFGLGVDGLVNELQAGNPPAAEARFVYDPERCGVNPALETLCDEVTVEVPASDLTLSLITVIDGLGRLAGQTRRGPGVPAPYLA